MTVVLFNNDETESTNDTQTWVTKISVTGTVRNVPHKIFVSCEYTGTSTNKTSAVRVLIDGVERGFDTYIPMISSGYHAFCSMGLMTPTAGEHTIALQFRSETLPQTTMIRRARILVEQH